MAASAFACTPVEGAERLWNPAVRWVVVGEIHGTAETPPAFLNLACLAHAAGRPVTVAIEYPIEAQSVIDTYLSSDGGGRAQAALLGLPIWHSATPDGRCSVAFLKMFDSLRRMKQAGLISGVVASDRGSIHHTAAERDAGLAQSWMEAPAPSDGIILIYVGNFHAIRRPAGPSPTMLRPAASLLPPARTLTVNAVGNGGTAWNCMNDRCGIHPDGAPRQTTPGITFSDAPDRRWDATYELGVATTASPPAAPNPVS